MTVDIPTDALFVPTDRRGRQFHRGVETLWSFPSPASGAQAGSSGTVLRPPETGHLVLLDVDGLLDDLSERIFVARRTENTAELVNETAWSLRAAARFALDCAEHVTAGLPAQAVPSGDTLPAVLSQVRAWLDDAPGADAALLGRVSRIALIHRLRRKGAELADLAFAAAIDNEADAESLFEDERWTAIAAAQEAVLATVEALRHEAFPHLVEAGNVKYEESLASGREAGATAVDVVAEGAVAAAGEAAGNPTAAWGMFTPGRHSGIVPAWVAATEAAERARQSVGDAGGDEAAKAERAWQRDCLARHLRGA